MVRLTRDQLLLRVAEQDETIRLLRQEVRDLQAQLDELRTQHARSAGPFRRRDDKKIPVERHKKPGRPVGHPGVHRPTPDIIDHVIFVPLTCCPHCQGDVLDCREHVQIIEEVPVVRPTVTKLTTQSGTCPKCGTVASTHELQTGRGHHASRVQLGPRALALAATLNKHYGLSMRKTCRILDDACGLRLSPGGLSQALDRLADRLDGDYQQLFNDVRAGPAAYVDETSWWVGAPRHHLHVCTNPSTTIYCISEGRKNDVVREILTPEYAGVLVTDCLNIYGDSLPIQQKHKCIAHHLKAIKEQLSSPLLRDRTYLESWRGLLQLVCVITRERKTLDYFFEHLKARCEAKCAALLAQAVTQPEDIRIRDRLQRVAPHLLVCLSHVDVEATNNRAERALRPAVIARKVSCGNKTPRGARTFERLASLAATYVQRGKNVIKALAQRCSIQR